MFLLLSARRFGCSNWVDWAGQRTSPRIQQTHKGWFASDARNLARTKLVTLHGWLEDDRFLLGFGLFSGAFAVTVQGVSVLYLNSWHHHGLVEDSFLFERQLLLETSHFLLNYDCGKGRRQGWKNLSPFVVVGCHFWIINQHCLAICAQSLRNFDPCVVISYGTSRCSNVSFAPTSYHP